MSLEMAALPCDTHGMCQQCNLVPPDGDILECSICLSFWHMQCLRPPLTSVPEGVWECPDCTSPPIASSSLQAMPGGQSLNSGRAGSEKDMMTRIQAIEADSSLSASKKAKRRQDLMENQGRPSQNEGMETGGTSSTNRVGANEALELLEANLTCGICQQLVDQPTSTPCGHNFCVRCYKQWIAKSKGNKTCSNCRATIPAQVAQQPGINSALAMAICFAKASSIIHDITHAPAKPQQEIQDEEIPEMCFTTEQAPEQASKQAMKPGKAHTITGEIFVTIPPNHFGPILAEHDPLRNQGVLVGETWENRMECRQWGVHFPPMAGIAGQSAHGAQSVALSGGYEDDEDHGEWFLYTGSGGRDLSGNKCTNKEQSFDQKFSKHNEALRVSCMKGYPVRVIRSHKNQRSSYAPEKGLRYDGIYRIEKCWRKTGLQGYKVCRYLFVRCDNKPAPWSSDVTGNLLRALPVVEELRDAEDVFERSRNPAWGWKEDKELWEWTVDPPESQCKNLRIVRKTENSSGKNHLNTQQKLLRAFGCNLCGKVLELPLSTHCGHNFCKLCLVELFAGQQNTRERTRPGGPNLRVQKVIKQCPACKADITDVVTHHQVNRQIEALIHTLKGRIDELQREETEVEVADSQTKSKKSKKDKQLCM